MILLTSNRKGQLYSSSQIEDYLYRGAELEKSSFFAFVINTWEEPFSSTREHSSSGQTNRKGRPRHERSHYLPEHPKSESHRHVFHIDGHNTLPHIQGPWFPRRDDTTSQDFYCACMLALLKPWRSHSDLIQEMDDWDMAFQSFLATMTTKEKQVLGGIDYYYELKSACEKNKDAGDLKTSPTKSNCERSKQAGLNSLDDDADELTEEAIALTGPI